MEMSKALKFQKMVAGKDFYAVTDCSHNGVCARCGGCCSDIIPLTTTEIATLRDFVKKNDYKPHSRVLAVMVDKPYDMTCPFLNSKNECDIYDIRPEVCRLFKCWEKNPSTVKKLGELPKNVLKGYVEFSKKQPTSQSMRQVIFGQEVPF